MVQHRAEQQDSVSVEVDAGAFDARELAAAVTVDHAQVQTKDSQQQDTLVSSTTASPCTHAVEPPCTGRYARWCERSAF